MNMLFELVVVVQVVVTVGVLKVKGEWGGVSVWYFFYCNYFLFILIIFFWQQKKIKLNY